MITQFIFTLVRVCSLYSHLPSYQLVRQEMLAALLLLLSTSAVAVPVIEVAEIVVAVQWRLCARCTVALQTQENCEYSICICLQVCFNKNISFSYAWSTEL